MNYSQRKCVYITILLWPQILLFKTAKGKCSACWKLLQLTWICSDAQMFASLKLYSNHCNQQPLNISSSNRRTRSAENACEVQSYIRLQAHFGAKSIYFNAFLSHIMSLGAFKPVLNKNFQNQPANTDIFNPVTVNSRITCFISFSWKLRKHAWNTCLNNSRIRRIWCLYEK